MCCFLLNRCRYRISLVSLPYTHAHTHALTHSHAHTDQQGRSERDVRLDLGGSVVTAQIWAKLARPRFMDAPGLSCIDPPPESHSSLCARSAERCVRARSHLLWHQFTNLLEALLLAQDISVAQTNNTNRIGRSAVRKTVQQPLVSC